MSFTDIEDIPEFHSTLMGWYDSQKRDLPWRESGVTPYGIWISEVMLQQTQVVRVVSYWKKWMDSFPNIKTLAKADINDVLAHWSGLGYYKRAMGLHKGAQYLIEHHAGEIPHDLKSLLKVPSIGPYIAAAVISSAYDIPAAAVDANIMRVYARIYQIEKFNLNLGESRRKIQNIADKLFDSSNCSIWNQAIMDLGALVCKPREVKCEICPLQKFCGAYRWSQSQGDADHKNLVKLFPLSRNTIIDKHSKEISHVRRSDLRKFSHVASAVIFDEMGRAWMEKRSSKGLLANMWDFPTISVDEFSKQTFKRSAAKKLQALLPSMFSLKRGLLYTGNIVHTFSHIRMQVEIFVGITDNSRVNTEGDEMVNEGEIINEAWMSRANINSIGISSLARKIHDASLKSKTFYQFFNEPK